MSAWQKFRDSKDVIERLLTLDTELSSQREPGIEKIKFAIFGGTAFLLMTNNPRFTNDIDMLLLTTINDHDFKIFEKYDVNNNMGGPSFIPDDFFNRAQRIDVEFENFEAYVPAPMDLILNKLLSRCDARDVEDIVKSGILNQVDHDELRELYQEYRSYAIGHPSKFVDIEEVLQQFQEYSG